MFDGLRKDASDASAFDEQAEFFPGDKPEAPARRRKPGAFLGLTAPQRFLLAVMLMMTVCVLGAMCMVVTGKFAF
jgi:hypothetical protein